METPSSTATATVSPPLAKKFPATRKRFQALSHPHIPRLVLDGEGSVREVSPAARVLLSYRSDDAIPPCFFSLIHAKNLYQVMRDVADMVCRGRSRASWLLRLRTGDGRWRWFKVQAHNHLEGGEGHIALTLQDLQDWELTA